MSKVTDTDLAWSPPPCCKTPYIGQYLTAQVITSIPDISRIKSSLNILPEYSVTLLLNRESKKMI